MTDLPNTMKAPLWRQMLVSCAAWFLAVYIREQFGAGWSTWLKFSVSVACLLLVIWVDIILRYRKAKAAATE
jgi:protein-S-isoprenylcysteine O-methyltransferase Ste14